TPAGSAILAVPPATAVPDDELDELLPPPPLLPPQPAASRAAAAMAATPPSRVLRLLGNIFTPSSWHACAPVMPNSFLLRCPATAFLPGTDLVTRTDSPDRSGTHPGS